MNIRITNIGEGVVIMENAGPSEHEIVCPDGPPIRLPPGERFVRKWDDEKKCFGPLIPLAEAGDIDPNKFLFSDPPEDC